MNQHTKKKPDDSGVSEAFERQVFRALVKRGHVIPETEAEVRATEERIEAEGQSLTETLHGARAVLSRIKNKKKAHSGKVVPMPLSEFAES